MWMMARSAISLFFRGRLFAEPRKAYARLAFGVLVTAALFLLLATAGLPLWAASAIGGFIGGGLQPVLFKTIRYQ
jgi:hypothetical protein